METSHTAKSLTKYVYLVNASQWNRTQMVYNSVCTMYFQVNWNCPGMHMWASEGFLPGHAKGGFIYQGNHISDLLHN